MGNNSKQPNSETVWFQCVSQQEKPTVGVTRDFLESNEIHSSENSKVPTQTSSKSSCSYFSAKPCGSCGCCVRFNIPRALPSKQKLMSARLNRIPPVNDRDWGWMAKIMPRRGGKFVKIDRTNLPETIKTELGKKNNKNYNRYRRVPDKDDDGNLKKRVTRSQTRQDARKKLYGGL